MRINTNAIKERIDLRELAAIVTTLRRESPDEMAGPCPKCGGTDRFHVSKTGFFCRHCLPFEVGKYHDAIEFAQWLHGLDFRGAIQWLANDVQVLSSAKRTPERNRTATAQRWNIERAQAQLKADQLALWDDASTAAHSYLLSRGLTPDTWLAFSLGYRHRTFLPGTWREGMSKPCYPPQPAIAIPWYSGGRLVAIRYRFLEKHIYKDVDGKERSGIEGKGVKQSAMRGSSFADHVFGGHVLVYYGVPELGQADPLALRTLVIIEGEMNSMSIWQVAHATNLDTLSLGSESSNIPESVAAYARRYGAILVWADKDEVGTLWKNTINGGRSDGNAYHVSSDMCKGMDANDMLQADKLGFYLTSWRSQITTDKERLLLDLVTADGERRLLDDGTRHAMRKLADQLQS